MLVERFNQVRARLDELRAGRAPPRSLLERARALFVRDDGAVDLSALHELDAELERAGVHTAADARLLRELGEVRGALGALSQGLAQRAEIALWQYERAVAEVERLAAAEDETAPSLLAALDADFRRLGRVVKVAAIFATPAAGAQEIFARPARAGASAPASARVAVAEYFAERARGNVADTAQKRRDLDLAYELVLRLSASEKGDRERLRLLRVELGAARDRVRAAPAVRSLSDLARHLRHVSRRDPPTAWRSVRALYERAVEAGDEALARVAGEAAAALLPREGLASAFERAEGLRTLGVQAARAAPVGARLPAGGKQAVDDEVALRLAQLAFDLDADQRKALELAAGCARFFDVEDALAEEIVEAETATSRPVQRRVPYPTQRMTYEPARTLDELQHFVIDQPGALILNLAAGKQMVRAYLEEEAPRKKQAVQQTAVRVYVLDASGSMHGARARFRDAILIAELNAMRVKALAGLPFDPLYFSFFNDAPTELVRVDSGAEATRQIEKLFHASPAEGQTDISLALMSAFDSIGKAQGRDPYLARATVVLVTDGEDGVDLELIRTTQRPFEGLQIALSFISLGEENADLKALVLEQRSQGARAFYHHLSDAEIHLARTEFDSAWRTLLPADVPMTPEALERLLPHLEALEAIAQERPAPRVERAPHQFEALFPEAPARGHAEPALVARLADALEAVAEAGALAPAETRPGEAVTLLVHLLSVYGVPVPQYLQALGAADERLAAARERVRLLCRAFE